MGAALTEQALVTLLLFARVGTSVMLMPMIGDEAVPRQVRLLLALGLTISLSGLLRWQVVPLTGANETQLAGLLLSETLTGLSLGLLARLFFQAVVMAGSLISLQTGLTTAIVFDPAMGGQVPLIGKLVGLAAAILCFALGLHQWWFAAIIRSYNSFPAGALIPTGDLASLAVTTVSQATALALSLAAPFLVFGILFNLVLGLATRMAPAIQVFFIAQPLLIAGGVALLAATIGAVLLTFADAYQAWLGGGWALG